MTHTLTLGGIRFHVPVELYAPDDDFFDVEIDVEWVPKDAEPKGVRVDAPSGLSVWIDTERALILLPVIHEQEFVWLWQLRQVTPIVAAWHNKLTLHASAVSINDAAYAFVGGSGQGKSTLAWELTKAGAKPVADDLACIRFDEDPHIALSNQLVPIAKIFFVSLTGDGLHIAPTTKSEALQMHLHNGFGEHGEPRVWGFQFDTCHRLVEAVPHFNLAVPKDRDQLPSIVEQLLTALPSPGMSL